MKGFLRRECQEAVECMCSCCFLALGASGGGKTFTLTGGPRRFEDRGLVPRSISFLFETLGALPGSRKADYRVQVSFFAARLETD